MIPVGILADGDLAFRRGTGILSHIVTTASNDGTYSHVGILKKIDNEWFVIHAVPDEPDFEGDVDRVKADSLSRFFANDRAVRGIIARVTEDTLAASKAARIAWEMSQKGILFDHDYNLLMLMVLITGAMVMLSSLVAQAVNEVIDPRMKSSDGVVC